MALTRLFKSQDNSEVFQELMDLKEEVAELKAETGTKADDSENDIKRLPVNRDYDFSEKIPEDVAEYREHEDEKTRILTDLRHRDQSRQLPRYLIGGPTGSGKTHLAEAIASELEIPLITIQGKYSMDEADLLGNPMLIDEQTVWSDGPLTKALLASQEQEVILLIDEVNRAPPESKGILFSALDNRCRVELDGRGGEVIQGKAENLIVIATMNEGNDYHTQDLDLAEKRRFGSRWNVDYLGKSHPEQEAEVITERTPASKPVAERLVKIANEIRDLADSDDSLVSMGVPTANLLAWARTAYSYKEEEMDNTVVEAAKDSVIKPLYGNKEQDDVLETVKDYADGAPFEEEGFKDWLKGAEMNG